MCVWLGLVCVCLARACVHHCVHHFVRLARACVRLVRSGLFLLLPHGFGHVQCRFPVLPPFVQRTRMFHADGGFCLCSDAIVIPTSLCQHTV